MGETNFDEIRSFDFPAGGHADGIGAMHQTGALRDGVPKVDSILRIPVVLQVIVGSTTLPVSDLLKLGRGAVIPLNSRVGDPVEVMINGREIARGEVVVIEDDSTRFGVSLTEIREPHLGGTHD